MSISSAGQRPYGPGKTAVVVKSLLGMSRAPVAIFVVAHAGLASIFAVNALPPLRIMLLGALASLTGTGSLIGLNDLLDVELDKRKIAISAKKQDIDLGSTFIHHPIARGTISRATGIVWVSALALISIYLIEAIRPGLWPILPVIAVLVSMYSKLSPITYWKFLAVASAVTLGALAGWLAVAPGSLETINGWLSMFKSGGAALAIFALWSYAWEVGGRNIPNDFIDVDEDRPLGTKTIPAVLGEATAARVIFAVLSLTALLSISLVWSAGFESGLQLAFILGGVLALDVAMLLFPAWRLLGRPTQKIAVNLYNRSAFYPLALLALLMVSLLLR